MPEVNKGETAFPLKLRNQIRHLFIRAVVTDHDFEIPERLAFAGLEDKPESFRFVVDRHNKRKGGHGYAGLFSAGADQIPGIVPEHRGQLPSTM